MSSSEITGGACYAPPQSDADVKPIETALRALDPCLSLVWNPTAYLACPGSFDAYGKPLPARHEGRWQVRRITLGKDECIYTVCFDGEQQKAYRAVGWWLVDFMQRWDAANVRAVQELHRLQAEDEKREADRQAQNEAQRNEAADRRAFDWSGKELFSGHRH